MTETPVEKPADPVLDALFDMIAPPDAINHKKITLYGDPGAGKTVLAATAPRPLFLSTDTGYESLENHPELAKNANRMPYKNFKAFQALCEKAAEGAFADRFDTLVIDTFSGVADATLKELSIAKFKKDPSRPAGQFVAEGKDYQENTEQMKYAVSLLTMAPMHVVYICHSVETKDDTTGRVTIRPALTPKLAQKVLADSTVLGFMTSSIDEGVTTRRLQVGGGSGKVWVKSRLANAPAIIDNPTFDMFLYPDTFWS